MRLDAGREVQAEFKERPCHHTRRRHWAGLFAVNQALVNENLPIAQRDQMRHTGSGKNATQQCPANRPMLNQ